MQLDALVRLIEDRADELAELMVRQIRESPRMAAYHRFGNDELAERARLVYANLGKWLEEGSEGLVEMEYFAIGERRCRERIPLSQVVWALLLTRRTLWHFVESLDRSPETDLRGTLELEILVVRFFDRAILHAVRGYESAGDGPKSREHGVETAFWPGG